MKDRAFLMKGESMKIIDIRSDTVTLPTPKTHIPQIKNRFWDLLGTHVLKLKND
jgi:hypothetical protein